MSDEAAATVQAPEAPASAEEAPVKPAAAEETPAPSTSAAAAEDAKKKEKERVKKEKDERKKQEAEEKKRKKEEEKKAEAEAKAEAKAKAKAEAAAAGGSESSTQRKPCWLTDKTGMDLLNRDKNQINCHINVQFEDIIAEPDPTVFSFDNVWTCSFKVFTSTKLWCYRIISLICAVPAAICWGIEFAMLSFCTIWCWQPSLKAFDISLWYTRRIYEILLKVFVEPCFHAIGKCLSHVVVTVRRE